MIPNGPHRKELDGLFGMCEMECAIEIMLHKSEKTGVPFHMLQMRPDEFEKDTLVGFCQLLARGMFRPGYPNIYFRLDQSLIKRMRERPQWKNIADAPTFEMLFDYYHPDFLPVMRHPEET